MVSALFTDAVFIVVSALFTDEVLVVSALFTDEVLVVSAPFAEEVLAVVTFVRCPDFTLVHTTSSFLLEALVWLLCPTSNPSVGRTLNCQSFRIQVLPEPPISATGPWSLRPICDRRYDLLRYHVEHFL